MWPLWEHPAPPNSRPVFPALPPPRQLPTVCSATPPHPRSHTPFPKLELGLGSRPATPRELPACSICLERLREPISLDCGHDFCTRCFSTHRVPGCEPPCCPECRKICKQKRGLRSLGEKMKLLPQRPLPAVLQVGGPSLGAGRRAAGQEVRRGGNQLQSPTDPAALALF